MKTPTEVVNFVFSLAKSLGVEPYKHTSSGKGERLVVNSLPITGDILQRCYVNVNWFVPDIKMQGEMSVPNTKRLEETEAALVNLFENHVNSGDIHLYIESVGIEKNLLFDEHFINLRLKVNLKNP
jgi:hypothetical protein